jgi:hypothetical protein
MALMDPDDTKDVCFTSLVIMGAGGSLLGEVWG